VRAQGPLGDFVAVGKTAKALLALIHAGPNGVTALETGTWALRLAAYVHVLRHQFGLDIQMQREEHVGGWHGRYRLISAVLLDSS
jgi:hypothetical protein